MMVKNKNDATTQIYNREMVFPLKNKNPDFFLNDKNFF